MHRALLRWSGRDAELVRLRGLVRYGHVLSARERWSVEMALAGRHPEAAPTPGGSRSVSVRGSAPHDAQQTNGRTAAVKIGQPASSTDVWDAGTYPGKVVEVVEEPAEQSKFGKPRLKWVIRATDQAGETQDLWYWTNCSLSRHQNATFRPFVHALAPELDLDDPDLEVDTEELVGKRCRVIVGVNEEKARNVVDKVLPAEARRVGKQATEPEPAREPAPVRVGRQEVPF